MATHDIAVLPGDGIGSEVIAEAVKVLERLEALSGGETAFRLEWIDAGAEAWRRTGTALSDEAFGACRDADAVLIGAMGLPDARHPDGREAGTDATFRLRFELDLYAGLRPVKLYPGAPSPLRDTERGIDYVLVRESTEGLYASRYGGSRVEGEVASDTMIVTRAGVRRVAERAFALARRRGKVVTCVDKANVLGSYAFFRSVVEDVASYYEDVRLDSIYVDAAALYLIQRPAEFDVIVTENMFGDILSDLGAATVGGLGLAPSGDVGSKYGVFQPSHGSAPDIAGRGVANPHATILSAAMMLDWLGDARAAAWIEKAVAAALRSGEGLTADLGGSRSTRDAGEAVLCELERATT
jgi:3-isopropylmalate dehydrogenase